MTTKTFKRSKSKNKVNKVSSTLVLFGITGDLAQQKLIPALFSLYRQQKLPVDFSIVSYGRKYFNDESFGIFIKSLIRGSLSDMKKFAMRCSYIQGELSEKNDFQKLQEYLEKVPGGKMFFLSVPPHFHPGIVQTLSEVGLLDMSSQIFIEKPFGEDIKTARRLENVLKARVREDQIYRVDHYLNKQALIDFNMKAQSSATFRKSLNDQHVKSISVSIYESKVIGKRGVFYDRVGALKDVGQNHLLQMIAAILAAPLCHNQVCKSIHEARALAIHSLKVRGPFVRAQYIGYKKEEGVSDRSQTETFFSLRVKSTLPNWSNTDICISSGKAVSESDVAANIVLKFHPDKNINKKINKRLVIELNKKGKIDAYENLFIAGINKDQRFFASLDEAIGGWKFVDVVIRGWQKSKSGVTEYPIGSSVETILKKERIV